ncbi:diacylglycerol kinase epsilon [Lutzomyia longipalpis]|uniref:diacylglycerol kinase epsilon n=1 Tax=Lutzomyia longipalpis TaxID=7200 RepID=UPI00248423B8|nr:diacylglycerol kinase epsilon [Lutzomyia longipalpis]
MIEWTFSLATGIIALTVTIWYVVRYLLIHDVVYIQGRPRHSWKSSKLLDRGCYCSVCEILLVSTGRFCDSCGVCSHPECIKGAEKLFKCKEKHSKEDRPSRHKWTKGNLPLNRICSACRKDMDAVHGPGLCGFRCIWCQMCVHTACFPRMSEDCDYGEFRDLIIPPNCIDAVRRRGSAKLLLKSIKAAPWPTWKPLIVIANVKSGSSRADDILSVFRGVLNPLQVAEMSRTGPQDALQWVARISPKPCRVLVAGGDGTIGWVMNTLFSMAVESFPEICVLPLGTGNDLSRVLNWGSEAPDTIDPIEFLQQVQRAEVAKLDRWVLEIAGASSRIPLKRLLRRNVFMYNYFSVGVDAQVSLNFHRARESQFYMLSSRLINKMLYLCFGTHQVVVPDCVGLDKELELWLDDEKIELPELQSVVFLNIDSWGAGVKLWEMSRDEDESAVNSFGDGIIEVLGIVSSFHIAQLQVGLSKPIRLGQARTARVRLLKTCPVQVDGEPWEQTPCEIVIKCTDQATVLKRKN